MIRFSRFGDLECFSGTHDELDAAIGEFGDGAFDNGDGRVIAITDGEEKFEMRIVLLGVGADDAVEQRIDAADGLQNGDGRHCLRLRTWDGTVIPYPFARFVTKFGEPFYVDPTLEGEAFEARLRELEAILNRDADELDAMVNMPPIPPRRVRPTP